MEITKNVANSRLVEAKFKNFLKTSSNGQALMLSGIWGSGKTYFFKTQLSTIANTHKPKPFKVLYVSLNGLSSIEYLDRALFLAAYPLLRNGFIQATGALIRGALKYASISIDEILKVEASIDEHTLLCFDDLERVKNTILHEVLGKISNLLEMKKAKVLILCDESKLLTNEAYTEGKEKIIGKTISFSPSPAEIGSNTIKLLAKELIASTNTINKSEENILEQLEPPLISALETASCRNMRLAIGATRTFLDFLDEIESTKKDFSPSSYSRLLRTIVSIYIQINEKPSSLSAIERVFAISEDDFYYLDAKNQETITANEFANNRLESREFPAVRAHEIFTFVAHGQCNHEALKKQLESIFGRSSEIAHKLTPEQQLQTYRRLQQSDFDQALNGVLENLNECRYKTLNELNSATTILFHLSNKGLLNQSSLSSATTQNTSTIDANLFSKIIQAADVITKTAIDSSNPSELLDLSWSNNAVNEFHARTIENLKISSQKIESQNWEKQKSALFRLISKSPDEFSTELLDIRKPFSRAAIFSSTKDTDEVISQINDITRRQTSSTDLHLIASAFHRRYLPADMENIINVEQKFFSNLLSGISALEQRLPANQTLIRSALADLSKTIESLAK